MKQLAVVLVILVGVLVAGCQTSVVKVTDTKIISAGQSINLVASESSSGAAMKIELDMSMLKMDETKLKAQGLNMTDLVGMLKGKCWLVVNCDTVVPTNAVPVSTNAVPVE